MKAWIRGGEGLTGKGENGKGSVGEGVVAWGGAGAEGENCCDM